MTEQAAPYRCLADRRREAVKEVKALKALALFQGEQVIKAQQDLQRVKQQMLSAKEQVASLRYTARHFDNAAQLASAWDGPAQYLERCLQQELLGVLPNTDLHSILTGDGPCQQRLADDSIQSVSYAEGLCQSLAASCLALEQAYNEEVVRLSALQRDLRDAQQRHRLLMFPKTWAGYQW